MANVISYAVFTESHKLDKSFNHKWENKYRTRNKSVVNYWLFSPPKLSAVFQRHQTACVELSKVSSRHKQTLADLLQDMERILEELGDAERWDEM